MMPTIPAGAKPIGPVGFGLYEVGDEVHVDEAEMLAFLGWPDTPASHEQLGRILTEVMGKVFPGTPVIAEP